MLELDSPFDEIDYLALDRAAAAVGIALLTEQDAANLSEYARSTLLWDILQQRYGASEQIFRRARSLGAELEGRQLAALAVHPPDLVGMAAVRGWSEQDTQQIRNTLLAEARQALAEAGCAGLCALEADSILAVVGVEPGRPTRAVLDRVGAEICLRISKRLDGLPVIVGVSMASDPESMRRAFDEAKEAMRYGPRVGRGAGVYHFEDLGVHRLLLRLSEGPELARFVESELEPSAEARCGGTFTASAHLAGLISITVAGSRPPLGPSRSSAARFTTGSNASGASLASTWTISRCERALRSPFRASSS